MVNTLCQEKKSVLHDVSPSGKVRKWSEYKMYNEYIAAAYEGFDMAKSARLNQCATWLQYVRDNDSGKLRLTNANFCRVRLCPVCSWRRSLKIYGQMSQIASSLGDSYRWILITMTMRNVPSDCLSGALDALRYGFNALSHRREWYRAIRGFYRSTEITRNRQTGEYHPHIHCLCAVKPSYFTSRYYLSQSTLSQMWAHDTALGLSHSGLSIEYAGDSDKCVDVRVVKPKDGQPWSAAVAEVSKYAVKASDIICFDDWDLTVDTVRLLDSVLASRRLATMGGVVRDMHKQLHLSDSDSGDADLLDIGRADGDMLSNPDNSNEVLYVWHSGYSEYVSR